MSYSVFTTTGSRAGRCYANEDDASLDRTARNLKAERMGLDVIYKVAPYTLDPKTDSRESVRDSYVSIN